MFQIGFLPGHARRGGGWLSRRKRTLKQLSIHSSNSTEVISRLKFDSSSNYTFVHNILPEATAASIPPKPNQWLLEWMPLTAHLYDVFTLDRNECVVWPSFADLWPVCTSYKAIIEWTTHDNDLLASDRCLGQSGKLYRSHPAYLNMRSCYMHSKDSYYYYYYYYSTSAKYWMYFTARFGGVHAFGYNSTKSEPIWMKSGALWVHCRGLALADFGRDLLSSDSWRAKRSQVSNARFHRFLVGQISRNLNRTRRSVSR